MVVVVVESMLVAVDSNGGLSISVAVVSNGVLSIPVAVELWW